MVDDTAEESYEEAATEDEELVQPYQGVELIGGHGIVLVPGGREPCAPAGDPAGWVRICATVPCADYGKKRGSQTWRRRLRPVILIWICPAGVYCSPRVGQMP